MDEPEEITSLRKALEFSPENLPLRKHYAASLVKYGRYEAAVEAYRAALAEHPDDAELKLGLAGAYHQLGRGSEAAVIAETLVDGDGAQPAACLLYSRILAKAGDLARAADYYHRATSEDESLADEALAEQLANYLSEFDVEPYDDGFGDGDDRVPAGDLPFGERADSSADIEKPRIKFDDVGGMEGVKEDVRMKIIHPIAHADLYKAYGKAIGGGILLYGPPGCGKTHLSRATAGEVKAGFLSVGLHDVLDMYIGQSEQKLHEIFQTARNNRPCVLFFDEVDALGASRSDLRQSASRNVINQFLSELDGAEHSNDGILVLAATNAPWHLDSALRRPGRFDQIIFVPPPDEPARASILRVLMRDKPSEGVDFDAVAKKAPGFSGADLKAVVDQAIEDKLKEAMKGGALVPVRTKDLLKAAKRVKPSTKEWFSTARNYALYSNQGGAYDDILSYLNIKK